MERRRFLVEVAIATLLGLGALATAFAAYKASDESGSAVASYNLGIKRTDEAGAAYNEHNQIFIRDQSLFLEFAKAVQADDDELLEYIYQSLMTADLRKAVDWWSETGDDGPETPFVARNPFYKPKALVKAKRLDAEASALFAEAQAHDEEGGRYDLVVVFLAASLFILGLAGVLRHFGMQLAFAAIGAVLLAGSLVQLGRIAL